MLDPVDGHYELVSRHASVDRMRRALQVLDTANISFVVEGGWAVAGYGSTVPSVDLDVLVPGGLTEEIAEAIEDATGLQMFSQVTHDNLALDFVDSTEANSLIDRPNLAYVPHDLLVGHIETRRAASVRGVAFQVPEAPYLCFMKLKAFHDRLLQWRAASGQSYLLAGISEGARVGTLARGPGHWLRKAGKDLYDASYLCHGHTTLDAVTAISPPALWERIHPVLNDVPLPVVRFAERMAERAGPAAFQALGTAERGARAGE